MGFSLLLTLCKAINIVQVTTPWRSCRWHTDPSSSNAPSTWWILWTVQVRKLSQLLLANFIIVILKCKRWNFLKLCILAELAKHPNQKFRGWYFGELFCIITGMLKNCTRGGGQLPVICGQKNVYVWVVKVVIKSMNMQKNPQKAQEA